MTNRRFEQSSSQVQWMIIRNNSSFLRKRKLCTLTTEPNNLKNRNSFRFNGLVNKKVLGIEAIQDGKGVVLTQGKTKHRQKPAKSIRKVKLVRDSRRTLTTIRRIVRKQRYRKDLKMAALRRASALLRGQKPVVVVSAKTPKAKTT